MREIKLFLLLVLLTGVGVACNQTAKEKSDYFKLDNQEYKQRFGMINDWGVDQLNTYREYSVHLQSSEGTSPDHKILFRINSSSLNQLEEGVYSYNEWLKSGKGEFSTLEVRCNLKYDDKGNVVKGTTYNASNSAISGTIEVKKDKEDYKFVFNVSIKSNDQIKNLTGVFSNKLNDFKFFG